MLKKLIPVLILTVLLTPGSFALAAKAKVNRKVSSSREVTLKAFGVLVKVANKEAGESEAVKLLNLKYGLTGEKKFYDFVNIYSFSLKDGPIESHGALHSYCYDVKKQKDIVYCELNLATTVDSE